MFRGDISNAPDHICAIDYAIFIDDSKYTGAWYKHFFAKCMVSTDFEGLVKRALPIRPGAIEWIERNFERRIVVVSFGSPELERAVLIVLEDHVGEFRHFNTRDELRIWLKQTPQVYRLFTNNPLLLGADEVTASFSFWNERA